MDFLGLLGDVSSAINNNEALQRVVASRAANQQALGGNRPAPMQYSPSPYMAAQQQQQEPMNEGLMYDQNAWDQMFKQAMLEDMFGSNPLLDYDRRDYGNPWG